jgi:hypothetical protein
VFGGAVSCVVRRGWWHARSDHTNGLGQNPSKLHGYNARAAQAVEQPILAITSLWPPNPEITAISRPTRSSLAPSLRERPRVIGAGRRSLAALARDRGEGSPHESVEPFSGRGRRRSRWNRRRLLR